MKLEMGKYSPQTSERWGAEGTLRRKAKDWRGGSDGSQIKHELLLDAGLKGKRALAELLVDHMAADDLKVSKQALVAALRVPDRQTLEQVLCSPARSALVAAAVTDFVRKYHHACYVRALPLLLSSPLSQPLLIKY